MAEVYAIYTEIKDCEIVSGESFEAIEFFVKFVESDSYVREIDNEKINFFLRYKSPDGRTDDTGYVKKIEKLSRWNWIDKFFYTIWFPWEISQRYLICTDDGRYYIFKFKNLSQKTLNRIEAILHGDEVKEMR